MIGPSRWLCPSYGMLYRVSFVIFQTCTLLRAILRRTFLSLLIMIWRKHIHKVFLRLPDSSSNWNSKMLVFEERGKPEYPEKNLSEQGEKQQQTEPTYGVDARI